MRADGSPSDGRAIGKVANDDRADWSPVWKLFPGDVAYIWHAGRRASEVQVSIESAGFEIRCQIIWAKQQFAIGRGDYHWRHEPCWYAVRKGKPGRWSGGRDQTTLWEINKPSRSDTGHSTQKPVECMARPIRNSSQFGDLVYEPFCGSGTTIIACEQLGRKCRAIEIDPGYVAVAIQRWADATSRTSHCNGSFSAPRAANRAC
jgi:DNA modification methylase